MVVTEYFSRARLNALTERTLTTEEALRARLQTVRTRGWAAVDQELEIGRRSVAAPIRDASGVVVAALSLSCGTAARSMDQIIEECMPPLRQTADQITAALGGGRYAPRPASGKPRSLRPAKGRASP